MLLTEIYQCLSEPTRLRMVYLLTRGPLCVCHFQAVLGEPQVKVSKHLAYLKAKKLVDAQRHQNWMIYRLPVKRSAELEKTIECLKACAESEPIIRKDLQKLKLLRLDVDWIPNALSCCDKAASKSPRSKNRLQEVRS